MRAGGTPPPDATAADARPAPAGGVPLPAVGERLGAYEVVACLRAGASAVLRARDTRDGRDVVLKLLATAGLPPAAAKRFAREMALAARLRHPHVVPLLEAGESPGRQWYAMPHVPGEALRTRLAREGCLPVADALRIGREIAAALAHAHEQGVVHRDVKPDNILLDAEGRALLADFGIARVRGGDRLTAHGYTVGTPAYMSPEQTRGDPVDARTDVYAWGCVLYELLTGTPPHAGGGTVALMQRRQYEPAPSVRVRRPDVPLRLAALIAATLATDAAARPVHGGALAAAVDALPPVRPPWWRRPVMLAAALTLVAALLTLAVVGGS